MTKNGLKGGNMNKMKEFFVALYNFLKNWFNKPEVPPEIILFPNSPFRTETHNMTINPNSAGYVQELQWQLNESGAGDPWINRDKWTVPIYITDTTLVTPVTLRADNWSPENTQLGQRLINEGVPIPTGAVPDPERDGHLAIYNTNFDKYYGFWRFTEENGHYFASWGAIIDNASQWTGQRYWTPPEPRWGETASSLPVVEGTILIKELEKGIIPHALAISIHKPRRWNDPDSFIPPALANTDGYREAGVTSSIPYGMRFRFKSNVVADPTAPPLVKMIIQAGKEYGFIVRDMTGASLTLYCENPIAYGQDKSAYDPYLNGVALWNIMKMFPWAETEVVNG